jgi:hypothetical protein
MPASREVKGSEIGTVVRHRLNRETGKYEPASPQQLFIKGPIPLDWMARANSLPGKAGAVGLGLWFLKGVTRSNEVKVTSQVEKIAGCSRKAVYAALAALEVAELIRMQKRPGCRPAVEILDAKRGAICGVGLYAPVDP